MILLCFLEIFFVIFLNLFLFFILKVIVGWFVFCLNFCLVDFCLILELFNFILFFVLWIVKLVWEDKILCVLFWFVILVSCILILLGFLIWILGFEIFKMLIWFFNVCVVDCKVFLFILLFLFKGLIW